MKCSLRWEKKARLTGARIIAGVDEAGRGPLAGPVVVAAAILPEKFRHPVLNDSKQLNPVLREALYTELTAREDIVWAVSVSAHDEVDRLNILRATHESMRRAALALRTVPDHVLIDGLPVNPFPFPQTAIVDGDALSLSIAAASIIAKVTRDRIMLEMHALYPEYEFAQHKGYSTALHRERLRLHGPCPIHRRSFLPVRQMLLPLDLAEEQPPSASVV